MVQFHIAKGPGRYDFSIAYMRGNRGDWIRCEIYLDPVEAKSSLQVSLDIMHAVPEKDRFGHVDRDNWVISGVLVPTLQLENQSGYEDSGSIPWIKFKASYGFKTPKKGILGLGDLEAEFEELKTTRWWAKAIREHGF